MIRKFPFSLKSRWQDPKGLVQVFVGPRQVGKTTAAEHLSKEGVTVFASADLPAPPTVDFIAEKWLIARHLIESNPSQSVSLVLDEVQKIPRWSEVVKGLFDEDRRAGRQFRVALLGSSALLIEKGLSESLTGRFEANYFPHWVYSEIKELTGADLATYMHWGGYPKVYDFIDDPERAANYLENSILEPSLGRDILALHSVDKPALLRQLFWYVSRLPAQLVSYEKILGHLQDRGNSATLAHYAQLLMQAFLVYPIYKYTAALHRTKKSTPKWLFPNPGLVHPAVVTDPKSAGFVFENLVGSHLLNIIYGRKRYELKYFRDDNYEVDFIFCKDGEPVLAIEVKSGRIKKMPTTSRLVQSGITCPLAVVTRDNVESFLEILDPDQLATYFESSIGE
jgi:hypothetical protein